MLSPAQNIPPASGMSKWGKRKLTHHITQKDTDSRGFGTIPAAFLALVTCVGSVTENTSKRPKILFPGILLLLLASHVNVY